jgi:hypothetical protein
MSLSGYSFGRRNANDDDDFSSGVEMSSFGPRTGLSPSSDSPLRGMGRGVMRAVASRPLKIKPGILGHIDSSLQAGQSPG